MPFRGVDPEGLIELAGAVTLATDKVRSAVHPALAVLERNSLTATSTSLATSSSRANRWSNDLAAVLRWRSQAISTGQNTRFDISALLRARFAAEAVFRASNLDDAYRRWIREWQADEQRVTDAVANISRWLSQSMTDWDVTNTDLHNIRLTLEALTGAEIDRVIRSLAPPQLERWISEMGHSINGFSREEKRAVFALLATNASADLLAKVHNAILDAAGEAELADFGTAIQTHAGDNAIVDFIAYVIARDLTSHQFSGLAPALALTGIGSGAAATTAIASITNADDALAVLIVDSLVHDESGGLLDETLTLVAHSAADRDRAEAFVTFTALATNEVGLVDNLIAIRGRGIDRDDKRQLPRDSQMVREIRQTSLTAATQLLEADAPATIMQLASDIDPDGEVTSSYWHLMVEGGRSASIANILRGLRGSDDIDLEAFSQPGPNPGYRYPNARNLAYAAATLNRGFTKSAEAAKGDIDAIARITGIATAVLGLVTTGAEMITSLGGAGFDWGVAAHSENVKDGIDANLASLIETVGLRMRPTDENLPDPPIGLGGAMTAWTNMYTGLLPFA